MSPNGKKISPSAFEGGAENHRPVGILFRHLPQRSPKKRVSSPVKSLGNEFLYNTANNVAPDKS